MNEESILDAFNAVMNNKKPLRSLKISEKDFIKLRIRLLERSYESAKSRKEHIYADLYNKKLKKLYDMLYEIELCKNNEPE